MSRDSFVEMGQLSIAFFFRFISLKEESNFPSMLIEILDLSGCNLEGGGIFLNDILVGISQFSNLRALGLNHYKKLSQIPELPSSLRLLDAHSTIGTSLPPMHSLVNCLKSSNQVCFNFLVLNMFFFFFSMFLPFNT